MTNDSDRSKEAFFQIEDDSKLCGQESSQDSLDELQRSMVEFFNLNSEDIKKIREETPKRKRNRAENESSVSSSVRKRKRTSVSRRNEEESNENSSKLSKNSSGVRSKATSIHSERSSELSESSLDSLDETDAEESLDSSEDEDSAEPPPLDNQNLLTIPNPTRRFWLHPRHASGCKFEDIASAEISSNQRWLSQLVAEVVGTSLKDLVVTQVGLERALVGDNRHLKNAMPDVFDPLERKKIKLNDFMRDFVKKSGKTVEG